jgi:anti-anti-sigma regulatory factor
MAQGDVPPGLLSKVAKFVTNPTKDWSEIGAKEAEQDSGYSKEALKEMIERKRQNDFVRKREFDHLRKLRRREPLTNPGQGGRPSFFQSSLTSNIDERAETLKKIDEIEAQMSHQWWKGKKDESVARPSSQAPLAAPAAEPDSILSPSAKDDSKFVSTEASLVQNSSQWPNSPQEYVPTQLNDAKVTQPAQIQPPTPTPRPMQRPISRPQPIQTPTYRGPIGAGFSTNRLFAVELADSLTDPDLEEAAIRFANGDDAGAEEGLLAALQGENLRPESAEAWMSALFDLYRATGQQERFESAGLEFANRFGRSPPAWFSTPDLLGRKGAEPAKSASKPAARGSSPVWHSPPELTVTALAELQTFMQRNGAVAPVELDWAALTTITPEAQKGLGELFIGLCATPMRLVFRGYDSLERALKYLTPTGDRSVSPSSWQMRMDALRVMRLQDEFELVALEYCVTFEVSPPSWQEARCTCELDGISLAESLSVLDDDDAPRSGWGGTGLTATALMGLDGEAPAVVELTGEIVGDAAEALAKLEAGMEGATRMVISCARLIRVDFSAAGSILNWVTVQDAKGCKVQFRDVNRIVAAFFNVIGINEHARVVPRNA